MHLKYFLIFVNNLQFNMVEKALGKYYFKTGDLPINVCKVNREQGISYKHDYTDKLHYHDFTEIIIILKGNSIFL